MGAAPGNFALPDDLGEWLWNSRPDIRAMAARPGTDGLTAGQTHTGFASWVLYWNPTGAGDTTAPSARVAFLRGHVAEWIANEAYMSGDTVGHYYVGPGVNEVRQLVPFDINSVDAATTRWSALTGRPDPRTPASGTPSPPALSPPADAGGGPVGGVGRGTGGAGATGGASISGRASEAIAWIKENPIPSAIVGGGIVLLLSQGGGGGYRGRFR